RRAEVCDPIAEIRSQADDDSHVRKWLLVRSMSRRDDGALERFYDVEVKAAGAAPIPLRGFAFELERVGQLARVAAVDLAVLHEEDERAICEAVHGCIEREDFARGG